MTLAQQLEIWIAAYAIKKPDTPFAVCVGEFRRKLGLVDDDSVYSLRLIPAKFSSAWHSTVRRFLCGYVIGGSDKLYEDDQTAIKLAVWLHGKKCTDRPIDNRSAPSRQKEIVSTSRAFANAKTANTLYSQSYRASLRSNWSACK